MVELLMGTTPVRFTGEDGQPPAVELENWMVTAVEKMLLTLLVIVSAPAAEPDVGLTFSRTLGRNWM
jgi:hypothetical protein